MNAPTILAPDRSRFLGGSDAAAVMGLSPWATPVELWLQKIGRAPKEAPDAAALKRFERGHRLEPFIVDMVVDKLRARGVEVEVLARNERYVDPEHAFLSCEIDFELRLTGTLQVGQNLVAFDGEHVNGDAKSVTGFARKKWGEEDTEDVPIEYATQFMHGLMVTGRRYCLVAALRSFDDVDVYWTVRDDETIAGMRAKLVSFWLDHVVPEVAPDPFTFSDVKALFPIDNGLAVEATQDVVDTVTKLRETRARVRELDEINEALTFELGASISPHSRLTYQGTDLATWKGQGDTRLDQKALAAAEIYERDPDTGEFTRIADPVGRFSRTKTVRVLRLVKPKKGSAE